MPAFSDHDGDDDILQRNIFIEIYYIAIIILHRIIEDD